MCKGAYLSIVYKMKNKPEQRKLQYYMNYNLFMATV